MGLESFNLVLRYSLSADEQQQVLAQLQTAHGMSEDTAGRYTSEIVESDYIIQMEARVSASSCGMSIRTALCCADRVVSAMLELARRVTADLRAQPQWDILHECRVIDVTCDSTEAILGECFAWRRKRLYECFGITSVPYAAKRPGNECLRYVHGFSNQPLKEWPGEPPNRS
jgi:hypothetical protein